MVEQQFRSDEEFLAWARSNPSAFVVNTRRNPTPDYMVLHKASCVDLSNRGYAPGALTERSYRKVGAASEQDLLLWIRNNVREATGFSRRCSRCGP